MAMMTIDYLRHRTPSTSTTPPVTADFNFAKGEVHWQVRYEDLDMEPFGSAAVVLRLELHGTRYAQGWTPDYSNANESICAVDDNGRSVATTKKRWERDIEAQVTYVTD